MSDPDRAVVVRLAPVGRDDRDRIRRWVAHDRVRSWWGPADVVEAEIAIALQSPSAVCRMIEADGEPVGYAHAFDGGLLTPMPGRGQEPGIWQCAFCIGSEAHRGHGLGATALELLTQEIFNTTLALGCEQRIPVRNERAVRDLEKIGFRWHRIEPEDPLGPVWIMRRDRPRA